MIRPGASVEVVTALGERVRMKALSEVVRGKDFLIVYVCDESTWAERESADPEIEGIPWPAEDVEVLA